MNKKNCNMHVCVDYSVFILLSSFTSLGTGRRTQVCTYIAYIKDIIVITIICYIVSSSPKLLFLFHKSIK